MGNISLLLYLLYAPWYWKFNFFDLVIEFLGELLVVVELLWYFWWFGCGCWSCLCCWCLNYFCGSIQCGGFRIFGVVRGCCLGDCGILESCFLGCCFSGHFVIPSCIVKRSQSLVHPPILRKRGWDHPGWKPWASSLMTSPLAITSRGSPNGLSAPLSFIVRRR